MIGKLFTYFQPFIPFNSTLLGMRQGTFHPLVFSGSDFVSWYFIKKLQKKLYVKIDINCINLTPCHWVFIIKMRLSGAKDENFYCFHGSCQLGLRLLLLFCLENCSDLLRQKLFQWSRTISGFTRAIYSNSGRSEQFLKPNTF